ncbi:MAG TPA: hypothetical protein VIG06_00565 [Kofleriaceae bacterium]
MSEEPTPKLPRGKWFGTIRTVEIIRIGMVATVLVVVVVLGRPCADGISRFVESYAPPPDAGPPAVQYERLTEEEIKKRFPGGEELDEQKPAARESVSKDEPPPTSP